MLNPYFLKGSRSEQNLVQNLINEQLRMYGVECYYIPRQYVTTKNIIKEVIESRFENAYPLEAYLENYEGYDGQGTLLSKFGIEEKDDVRLTISRERFETYIVPLMSRIPDIKLGTRPREGDIIYFPLGDRLFEVKYVEHEKPFYQLNKNYVYTLTCELFRYEDEVIDTGIEQIDDDIVKDGYIQTLSLIGIGSTATAITSTCPLRSIQRIYVENRGSGYKTLPTINISAAPPGGVNATGFASLSSYYVPCENGFQNGVSAICLENPGCGYSGTPWVTINGGGGTGAAATVKMSDGGSIGIVTITSGGSGYTTNPLVLFERPLILNGSPGANDPKTIFNFSDTEYYFDSTLITFDDDEVYNYEPGYGYGIINSAGVVTAICIIDAGSGFAEPPEVFIERPSFYGVGVGTGSFIFNEVVRGETSGTESRVKTWNAVTGKLEVSIIDGNYQIREILVGQESGAKFIVGGIDEFNTVDKFNEAEEFEIEGDKILDFSVSNPFGNPW